MRLSASTAMLCGAVLFVGTQTAVAQYPGGLRQPGMPGQYQSPTVSPYLNLLGPNQSRVATYQTLVRPMKDERDTIANQGIGRQLQQQSGRASSGQRAGSDDRAPRVPKFLNYSHYYGTLRR